MALPTSGTLGMNSIRTELGIPSQAPFSLDTAENGGYVTLNGCSQYKPNPSNPAAISEWYGYNHTATIYNYGSFNYSGSVCCAGGGGPAYNLYSCISPSGMLVCTSNCYIYLDSMCNTLAGTGYYSDGVTCYTVVNGIVTNVSGCATTTTTTPPTTTTTTAGAVTCHNFQATASSYISYTDCCGVFQSYYILVGDTFCAQVGTVYGYYVDLNTTCNC